jgi:ParB family chromosome partitioning protein
VSVKTDGARQKRTKRIVNPEAAPVDIELLKPHPRNYRHHPPDQIEHLKASLREHGVYRNVVAARDWTILAGHGLVLAAKELGWKAISTAKLDIKPDSPRALKILAGDNEIAHLAE